MSVAACRQCTKKSGVLPSNLFDIENTADPLPRQYAQAQTDRVLRLKQTNAAAWRASMPPGRQSINSQQSTGIRFSAVDVMRERLQMKFNAPARSAKPET
jgi:hypothetical protein